MSNKLLAGHEWQGSRRMLLKNGEVFWQQEEYKSGAFKRLIGGERTRGPVEYKYRIIAPPRGGDKE
jgi:hypothetical protein